MEISARFSQDKLDHTKENTPFLVVSLTAPTLDWVTKRPAICVIPTVDLSGSMQGAKLEYAKKSMLKLVDQLQPGDVAGLVSFSSSAKVVVQPAEVTADFKTILRNAINKLHTGGGTNLCDGMLKAVEAVQSLDLAPKYIKRVILFTDGQPTEGVTDQRMILNALSSNRTSVTLSAFGYGEVGNPSHMYNGCDQDFLTKLSQEGAGNYAYVKDPDDALLAFGRELGGLISTYAQDIMVDLEPANGHQIVRPITDITIEQNALGETEFKIPDILSEETRHFVFETKLNAQDKVFPRPLNLFTVRVRYTILTESGKRETVKIEGKAKAEFVAPGEEVKEVPKELGEVIALAQVVRAQLEAEERAKKGDYATAGSIMEQAAVAVAAAGFSGSANMARSVGRRVQSHAAYSHNAGYLRTMAYAGTRGYGMSSMDAEAAAELAEAGVVFGNSSMQHTSELFVSEENPQPNVNLEPAITNWINAINTPGAAPVIPAPSLIIPSSLGESSAAPLIVGEPDKSE